MCFGFTLVMFQSVILRSKCLSGQLRLTCLASLLRVTHQLLCTTASQRSRFRSPRSPRVRRAAAGLAAGFVWISVPAGCVFLPNVPHTSTPFLISCGKGMLKGSSAFRALNSGEGMLAPAGLPPAASGLQSVVT